MQLAKLRGQASIETTYLDRYDISIDVRGKSITRSVLGSGNYQFESMETLAKFCDPSALRFVNIGANIGTTCLNAHYVGFRDILAIEPVASNFALLSRNLERNGIDAERHKCAAGDAEGEAMINIHPQSGGRHSFKQGFKHGHTEAVQVKRIGTLLDERPFVLWLDVEGFELEAMRGVGERMALCAGACVEVSAQLVGAQTALETLDLLAERFDTFMDAGGERFDMADLRAKIASNAVTQIDLIAVKSP